MNSSTLASRMVLGTAQFGLDYGVANTRGKVPKLEAARILDFASARGVGMLDTAVSYGRSESILGDIGISGWRAVSKLPAVPDNEPDVDAWVNAQVAGSLLRLGTPKLHGLLLHKPRQLLDEGGKKLYAALRGLKSNGLVDRIGVSIYEPSELDDLGSGMVFDIVQAPLNALDSRIVDSGWLARLEDSGCEVHARSIFLQGLLLMSPENRPARFSRWSDAWRTWDAWLAACGLTPLEACLGYALSVSGIRGFVLGVDSLAQLQQILSIGQVNIPAIPASLRQVDPRLLNPSMWTD